MAFSDFKYPDVLTDLGLAETSQSNLYRGVPPLAPKPGPSRHPGGERRAGHHPHREAARVIWMVGPVLAGFWPWYDSRIGA
jgi:hypothetical protein